MSNISYLGTLNTGHDCFPPSTAAEASPDTYVNGIAVLREGDSYQPHSCSGTTDIDSVSQGSPDVYVNGKPIARMGDPVSPGGSVAEASPDVYSNS